MFKILSIVIIAFAATNDQGSITDLVVLSQSWHICGNGSKGNASGMGLGACVSDVSLT